MFAWAYTDKHIVHFQDSGGDENWRIYATDLDTDETRDLTPMEGIQARIQQVSTKRPAKILAGINQRNPQFHDVYQIDIDSGEMELVYENDRFLQFLTDDDYELREAYQPTSDGGMTVYRLTKGAADWVEHGAVSPEDALSTDAIGFTEDGKTLYMIDSRDRDTAALYAVDWESDKCSLRRWPRTSRRSSRPHVERLKSRVVRWTTPTGRSPSSATMGR